MSVVSYITEHKSRLLSWGRKGGLAVLDQGLFSGANFLVNILLARWLEPKEYGAFAVTLSVFYLLAGFHTAVLTEPMMIFGAGKYRKHFRKYLGMLLYGHWGISALIALGLGTAAFVMRSLGSQAMAQALAGLALASPFLLLLWLTRRGCYAEMRPQWTVVGSLVNLVTLTGLFLLWNKAISSSFLGWVMLGISSCIGSVTLMAFHFHPQHVSGMEGDLHFSVVLSEHWRYGVWSLFGMLAFWASGQILFILAPLSLGLDAGAALAASWNLYRPTNLFLQMLQAVFLPTFSYWISQGIPRKIFRRRVILLLWFLVIIMSLYTVLLTIFAQPIMDFLYAGKYLEHWKIVGVMGTSLPALAITAVSLLALKALGYVQMAPVIWGASALFVVVGGLFAMKWGIFGVAIIYTISYWLAAGVAIGILYRHTLEKQEHRKGETV